MLFCCQYLKFRLSKVEDSETGIRKKRADLPDLLQCWGIIQVETGEEKHKKSVFKANG